MVVGRAKHGKRVTRYDVLLFLQLGGIISLLSRGGKERKRLSYRYRSIFPWRNFFSRRKKNFIRMMKGADFR